jgi:hypothetical protein
MDQDRRTSTTYGLVEMPQARITRDTGSGSICFFPQISRVSAERISAEISAISGKDLFCVCWVKSGY